MACEPRAWGGGLSTPTPHIPKGSEEDSGVPSPLSPFHRVVRNTSACPLWLPWEHGHPGFSQSQPRDCSGQCSTVMRKHHVQGFSGPNCLASSSWGCWLFITAEARALSCPILTMCMT